MKEDEIPMKNKIKCLINQFCNKYMYIKILPQKIFEKMQIYRTCNEIFYMLKYMSWK